jgi:hypothetical protein
MTRHRALPATLLACLLLALFGCTPEPSTPSATPSDATVTEIPAVVLPLSGPLGKASAEISGMAWYGDALVLLPQYPSRFGESLFTLPRSEILAYLEGERTAPLEPTPIPFLFEGLEGIAGFEGFEAIAFEDASVFLTIEARQAGGMVGYLVAGEVAEGLSEIRVEAESLVELPPQAPLDNFSDELLLVTDGSVLTLYETSGVNVNPSPVMRRFSTAGLEPEGTLPFPNIEYRLTDATAIDAEGRFWAINYLWPGDVEKLQPGPDPLAETYGEGPTHAASTTVERLVEFRVTEEGIVRTERPPLQLRLLEDDARNWEGLVRLPGEGFLLATDKFPETILAFVAGE